MKVYLGCSGKKKEKLTSWRERECQGSLAGDLTWEVLKDEMVLTDCLQSKRARQLWETAKSKVCFEFSTL